MFRLKYKKHRNTYFSGRVGPYEGFYLFIYYKHWVPLKKTVQDRAHVLCYL